MDRVSVADSWLPVGRLVTHRSPGGEEQPITDGHEPGEGGDGVSSGQSSPPGGRHGGRGDVVIGQLPYESVPVTARPSIGVAVVRGVRKLRVG